MVFVKGSGWLGPGRSLVCRLREEHGIAGKAIAPGDLTLMPAPSMAGWRQLASSASGGGEASLCRGLVSRHGR